MENSDSTMVEKSEARSVEISSFTELIHTKFVSETIESWPNLKSALEKCGLSATLNQDERSVTVSTTASTKHPKMLHNAWFCVVYFAQARASLDKALSYLDTKSYFDYLNIGYHEGGFATINKMKKDVYIKKRDRLFQHLKELQALCKVSAWTGDHYITVAASTHSRIRRFRKVVERCIVRNDDPAKHVYSLQKHRAAESLKRLKI